MRFETWIAVRRAVSAITKTGCIPKGLSCATGALTSRGMATIAAPVIPAQVTNIAVNSIPKHHLMQSSMNRGFSAKGVPSSLSNKGLSTVAAEVRVVKPLVAGGATAQRQVFWWMTGCTGWVFSMVVLGGVTRLTRSGLSMTDWKFAGGLPPLTEEEWEIEFAKYKKSPEYRTVNQGMNLENFKFIYWLEYAHRMWGRVLGVAFAVPCTYFAVRGYITWPLAARLGVLFTLGGCQAFVGWWMVKSGLEEPKNHQIARVSPYRLATHLTSAFVIYTGMLWTSLSVLYPTAEALNPSTSPNVVKGLAKAQKILLPLSLLIAVTAVSGAFVAGLDAGHAYNTFPLMDGQLVPLQYWSEFSQTIFQNTFENTAAVQFHHRVLAVTTLCSVTGAWAILRNTALTTRTKACLNAMLAMTYCQVALGISTLLLYVPVSLGSAHQAGALTLMSLVVAALHSVRGAASRSALMNTYAGAGKVAKDHLAASGARLTVTPPRPVASH